MPTMTILYSKKRYYPFRYSFLLDKWPLRSWRSHVHRDIISTWYQRTLLCRKFKTSFKYVFDDILQLHLANSFCSFHRLCQLPVNKGISEKQITCNGYPDDYSVVSVPSKAGTHRISENWKPSLFLFDLVKFWPLFTVK